MMNRRVQLPILWFWTPVTPPTTLTTSNCRALIRRRFRVEVWQPQPPRDGIVGTSTAQHSFTGNSRPRRSQMKSIFVGNGSSNTTVTSLRHHLNSIGLSDNVVDIQTVNTKYSDAKSFCVTLSSIDAENKAYNSLWPDRVVVRPYRPPKNKSYNTNNYNYQKNTTLLTTTMDIDTTVHRTTQLRSLIIRHQKDSGLNNI